jgi:hypothetical protein
VLNALLAFSESTVALQAACRQHRRGRDLKSGTRLSLQIQIGIKEDFGADWRISSISETRDGFETFNIWGKGRRRISVNSEIFSPPVTAPLNTDLLFSVVQDKLSLCFRRHVCRRRDGKALVVWGIGLYVGQRWIVSYTTGRFKSFLGKKKKKKGCGKRWTRSWSGHGVGLSWWTGKTGWNYKLVLQSTAIHDTDNLYL